MLPQFGSAAGRFTRQTAENNNPINCLDMRFAACLTAVGQIIACTINGGDKVRCLAGAGLYL
ncbi:MAG: hypothetical protein CFE35_01310 [Novosphingobium sp. PASSN1]|nr:MAG: hypothetical protein CFE35_01310 [Novosphingobium sp. PASSN1]